MSALLIVVDGVYCNFHIDCICVIMFLYDLCSSLSQIKILQNTK